MVDTKIKTFIALTEIGSYTKTAKVLALTQPAVSHQMKQLELEFGVQLFHKNRKTLLLTPEGEIFLKYARRLVAIESNALQALDDAQNKVTRFSVGITATLAEYVVSGVFAEYCNEHPGTHINISTDTIKNIYDKLQTYALDFAIIEGNIPSRHYQSVLLDTDYICLMVSPKHPFARRRMVQLEELKKEKFILRPPQAGTRSLFENYLEARSENLRNFNVVLEVDNVTTIKSLVEQDFGITIIAHSVCIEELAAGRLAEVPVQNFNTTREINLVCREHFAHQDILHEIRQIYTRLH